MMSKATGNDIKELKDLLNSRFEQLGKHISTLELGQTEIKKEIKEIKGQVAVIDSRLSTLELGQTEIKGQISVIDSRLKTLETTSQKIPDLAEKVGELKNWKQIALSLGGALIGGFITYLLKTPNP